MRRREFITLIGGAAAAWPLAAGAQQTRKLNTIGFLNAGSRMSLGAIFPDALRELEWIDGANVVLEIPLCRQSA
jgi:putative ABC transport system substrate-binding protein